VRLGVIVTLTTEVGEREDFTVRGRAGHVFVQTCAGSRRSPVAVRRFLMISPVWRQEIAVAPNPIARARKNSGTS
jgi:hypothetical protein